MSKIRHGSLVQNIVIGVCEKFHNDRLRNDGALVHWKSDNNPKNNVGSAGDPFPGAINNEKLNNYSTSQLKKHFIC